MIYYGVYLNKRFAERMSKLNWYSLAISIMRAYTILEVLGTKNDAVIAQTGVKENAQKYIGRLFELVLTHWCTILQWFANVLIMDIPVYIRNEVAIERLSKENL